MITSSSFNFANFVNFQVERRVQIVIIFKVENIRITKNCPLRSQYLSPKLLLELVEKIEELNIQKISLNRPIMKFVKNDRQFVSFEKLDQQQYASLLSRDTIEVEYLYRNKRDEVAKKISKFQIEVLEKHTYLMQISKDQSTKIDLLKRLASKKSGLSTDASAQIKVKISLFISDPLVRAKSIPVGHDEIDIEEQIKVLKQASNAQKSLTIHVDKHYAIESNISIVFGEEVALGGHHKKTMRIVHFYTNVVRKDQELFIIFQDKKSAFGQEKLISAFEFFEKIKKSPINLLILIGNNVNLLQEEIKKRSLQFIVVMLSTYDPNTEEGLLFFLKTFYEQLFDRNQIGKAISIAQQEYKQNILDSDAWKNNIVCCCLHQHSDNCAWMKIVQQTGSRLAHQMFSHKNIKSTALKALNTELQIVLVNQLGIEAAKCSTLEKICCQESHVKKDLIMETKILASSTQNSKHFFEVSQNFTDFGKNQFHLKMDYQKISQTRRCPLIIYQIVKTILTNKGKIIQMGSRRVGKSHFIQAACKYIHNRKKNYDFQNVDLNQGSLQQCIKYMYSKAQKHKNDKKMVFIYHNNAISIEKQYIRHFKQNKNHNQPFLPFTFIIKTQQEGNPLIPNDEAPEPKSLAYISIPRPRKFDIICQVYQQLPDHYLQENKNLFEIVKFAQKFDNLLTYRILRNFLKYFNEKQQQSKIRKGKSLEYVYSYMQMEFFNKITQIQTSNKSLFDFLGFIAQFAQGIYLTKLNQVLLKQAFGIDDLKTILKNKENLNYFFEVIQKVNFVKAINIKSQKIDFIIPEEKVINYFKNNENLHDYFHQMKVSFFNYFFTVIETLIYDNINVVGNRLKKQRVFLDEGIFLFNDRKSQSTQESQEDKMTRILTKDVELLYANQVDLKILYLDESKYKLSSSKLTDLNTKSRLLKQKTVSIILHESQRYLLYRHLTNLCGIISTAGKKYHRQHKDINQQNNYQIPKHHKGGRADKCPIFFYKKMYLVYRLLLKQPQKYQLLKAKLQKIQPKLIAYYQSKGSQILTELIQRQEKQPVNRKSQPKFPRSHQSFNFLGQENTQNQHIPTNISHHVSAENYFQKLINFLQIQILINRHETFSLSFNEYGAKRKSGNQMNKERVKVEKSCFEKRLQSLLPKIKKEVKSEQLIWMDLPSQKHSQNTFLWSKASEYKFLSSEELVILIIHKLLLYECEEQYINYFYDLEQILGIIDREIKFFEAIMEINCEIQQRKAWENMYEKYRFLASINKEQLTMQVLRLHMRKIEIHFRLKRERRTLLSSNKAEQNVQRLIDLKSFEYLQTCCKVLEQSYSDPKNIYFSNEKVHKFLKNAEICQKYIHSVCENDKVTEEFTTLIGEVDNDYKEIFSYLCEQAWKKMLFNQTNNIIFFRSRVIVYKDKPYAFVRKRNVTMKYVKKMLSDIKINISFLHLTRSNFNFIQIDKRQNPNCKIKYLVLTVDSEIINGQICLIFEQQNNITHDILRLETFIEMMNTVNVEFIIVMGRKALFLAKQMTGSLKTSPIIVALENANAEFGLDNFVEFIGDNNMIPEEDEFLFNSESSRPDSPLVKQIFKYLDIECYHTLLDLIICTLVANLVQLTQQRHKFTKRSSYENDSYIPCSYKRIKELVIKSINMAKEIMRTKWESAKEIEIVYEIFPFSHQTESSTNISVLRKTSSLAVPELSQMPLANKYSTREQCEIIRYFPHFQKGFITDNTMKLYESPLNLQDEEYYENVNRNQQLFSIMSFIQCEGRRVVQIYGGNGSGKSSFLREICWINQTYRLFKDGVYMFDTRTLLSNSETLLWHVEIFYKDHKLFSILQEDFAVQKTHPSTIIVALDNLDSESIRDNHEFFERLKGKPICLIYSTRTPSLFNELKNYMSIDLVNAQPSRGRHMSSHDSINPHLVHSFSQKNLNSHHSHSHHHFHHSLSHEFQKKKSEDFSSKQFSSENTDELWHFLHVSIHSITKSALFNIALSYLKKEEMATFKVGIKQFIRSSFAIFLTQIFGDLFDEEPRLPNSFSIANSRTFSTSEHLTEQKIQQQNGLELMEGARVLQRIQSQIPGNSWTRSYPQQSLVQRLIRQLQQYFRQMRDQKMGLDLLELSTSESRGEKRSLLGSLPNKILGGKRDSRLWFYEDCFEQLLVMNNTYDQMRLQFR